ncbi:hypothetical protein Pst134EB_020088 [Puccinia striiformis f. sp. tritici]|nr:hypothetical protein Pst134EB_020088 [Puccinia striiformis f. sp. tritici]
MINPYDLSPYGGDAPRRLQDQSPLPPGQRLSPSDLQHYRNIQPHRSSGHHPIHSQPDPLVLGLVSHQSPFPSLYPSLPAHHQHTNYRSPHLNKPVHPPRPPQAMNLAAVQSQQAFPSTPLPDPEPQQQAIHYAACQSQQAFPLTPLPDPQPQPQAIHFAARQSQQPFSLTALSNPQPRPQATHFADRQSQQAFLSTPLPNTQPISQPQQQAINFAACHSEQLFTSTHLPNPQPQQRALDQGSCQSLQAAVNQATRQSLQRLSSTPLSNGHPPPHATNQTSRQSLQAFSFLSTPAADGHPLTDSTSRPASPQPRKSRANPNRPSQTSSTQASQTGTSKSNPSARSKKATQSQATDPTQPRFAALPSLQAELRRAIDANAKTTKAKAANAAKAAERATAKALALAEEAKAAEAAEEAVQANERGQPALTILQLTAESPTTTSRNSAFNATHAPELDLNLDFSGLRSVPASPKATLHAIEDFPIDHSDRPGGHDADDARNEDDGHHHEDDDHHHDDRRYEDDGQPRDDGRDADDGQLPDRQAMDTSVHDHDEDSVDDINCDVVRLVNGNTRLRLKPQTVQRLEGMALDELRERCYKHKHYSRLVAKDKADLDEATDEYDKHILRIACRNKLKLKTVEAYLGQGHCARGTNRYSEFCRYNLEARIATADGSKPMHQRWVESGRLWRQLTKEEQEQYDDPDFLAQHANPFEELELEDGQILPACKRPT